MEENWTFGDHAGRTFYRLDLDTGVGIRALAWRKLGRDKYWWCVVNVREPECIAHGSALALIPACDAAEAVGRALGLLRPRGGQWAIS